MNIFFVHLTKEFLLHRSCPRKKKRVKVNKKFCYSCI